MSDPTPQIIDPASADAALNLLSSARRIVIPTHQNVDADVLASALAMMHAMKTLGIEIIPIVTDGRLPKSLAFLPGVKSARLYGVDPLPEFDLICMLDCSDKRRLAGFYDDDPARIESDYPIVNIDHHVTNDSYGVVNIVVPEAAATAEIVAELIKYWGIKLNKTIAQCLLAGIYGDTLGLRTDATRSRTMRTSAELVDAGANPSTITDALFRIKPKSTVCLWEHALRNVAWTGSLIWTEVNADTLRICGADASEAEGIVNFLSGTDGSRAAAMLYQTDTGYRVSMRSLTEDVDVAAIASTFGGGGHPRAAGVSVSGGPDERDAFLVQVAALLQT